MVMMPKKVYEIIRLVHTKCYTEFLQLDRTNAKTLGVVNDVPMNMYKYPKVSVIQEILVVDITPMFSLCIS